MVCLFFFRRRFYVFLARIKHLEWKWKGEDDAQFKTSKGYLEFSIILKFLGYSIFITIIYFFNVHLTLLGILVGDHNS